MRTDTVARECFQQEEAKNGGQRAEKNRAWFLLGICKPFPPARTPKKSILPLQQSYRWRGDCAQARDCERRKGSCCLCAGVGLDGGVRDENGLHPAADARGDWLLCRGAPFANALRGGLNGVRGPERFDLFGHFRSRRQRFGGWLRSRCGQGDLQLVPQGGEPGKVGIVLIAV